MNELAPLAQFQWRSYGANWNGFFAPSCGFLTSLKSMAQALRHVISRLARQWHS
jgi:hypothetical protein